MGKHQMPNFIAILFSGEASSRPVTALWVRRNLGWVGSVLKQQLLLPGCVRESLARLEAEAWDLLAVPPASPRAASWHNSPGISPALTRIAGRRVPNLGSTTRERWFL